LIFIPMIAVLWFIRNDILHKYQEFSQTTQMDRGIRKRFGIFS
jgi:hypothetical protein